MPTKLWFKLRASSIEYSMTFLARGVCGSLPIVIISGPLWTSFSTSKRILRRSTSRFLSTLAATPVPSLTRPNNMCSVPMYSWLKRCASWLASCMTLRARSVKRSYIFPPCRSGSDSNNVFENEVRRALLRSGLVLVISSEYIFYEVQANRFSSKHLDSINYSIVVGWN